jgi:hypothetical protein
MMITRLPPRWAGFRVVLSAVWAEPASQPTWPVSLTRQTRHMVSPVSRQSSSKPLRAVSAPHRCVSAPVRVPSASRVSPMSTPSNTRSERGNRDVGYAFAAALRVLSKNPTDVGRFRRDQADLAVRSRR